MNETTEIHSGSSLNWGRAITSGLIATVVMTLFMLVMGMNIMKMLGSTMLPEASAIVQYLAGGMFHFAVGIDDNDEYIEDLHSVGRWVAEAARAGFMTNWFARVTRIIEVPHNLGGVPMGDSAEQGAVDHAGRVFGYENLLVLDGSTIPVALGPNPALTIVALSERAMEIAKHQLLSEKTIRPDP